MSQIQTLSAEGKSIFCKHENQFKRTVDYAILLTTFVCNLCRPLFIYIAIKTKCGLYLSKRETETETTSIAVFNDSKLL